MNRPTFCRLVRRFLALACALGVPTITTYAQGSAAHGKTALPTAGRQQFPPDHPAFRIDLPSNWTVDRGNEDHSMLICNVVGRADIGLLCMAVPNVFSQDDFVRILPGMAQEQLEQQGINELELVSQGHAQANGSPYFFVIAKGTLKKRKMSVTLLGLMSPQGRGYLLEYALPSADGPAHIKDFQTIMDSLTAIQ